MDDILDIEVVAEVDVEVENEVDIDVEVEPTGPQGKDGLSAYDIYVKNGGILTEAEWLASLKGETGQPGQDGKTPIIGEDYWTAEDQNEIKTDLQSYVDKQLGVVEDAYY